MHNRKEVYRLNDAKNNERHKCLQRRCLTILGISFVILTVFAVTLSLLLKFVILPSREPEKITNITSTITQPFSTTPSLITTIPATSSPSAATTQLSSTTTQTSSLPSTTPTTTSITIATTTQQLSKLYSNASM